MPQMNSDEASIDEPKTYTAENFEEDQRWHESDNLSDIKGDLVGDLDGESRISNGNQSKSTNHTHPDSNKDGLDRDPRDESKGPSRPHYFPPIVSGLNGHPLFSNASIPPTSKVSPYHPYSLPNPYLLPYGPTPPSELDSKTGLPRSHPDIPSMYALPGNLGQIPHPLAPWVTPASMYPMCTASSMAATMLRYQHPFAAAFSVGTTGASVAANMSRFPLSAPHGMHPSMLGHAGLGNGGMPGMGAGSQHPKLDLEKHKHSKSDHHGHHSEKERKSDRPYVKKPLNAFMLYMKEQRAKVVAECTLKESAAINQILGRKWHSLSRDEQQKYYEMARKERQLHMQLYPGWSARDNYGKRKKRKKEKSQGECTAQNSKKCRAVFGLDQQHLWCAPCRRKKKCIRYQHDGDDSGSEYEDIESPLSPPSMPDSFNQRRPNNPFDALPTNPQQPIINGLPNGSTFSGSNRPSSNSPPHSMKVKEEMRNSPDMVDGANKYNSYSQSTKQHGKDNRSSVQENRSSPPNNAVTSHSTAGSNNSIALFGHSVEKSLMKQKGTQSSHANNNPHRTDASNTSSNHHTKTSSSSCFQDSSHSSLSSSSGSPNNAPSRANEKSRLSDQGNSSREYHPYKNNSNGPSTPRMKSINHAGMNPFLPPSSGNSPLLSPNNMGFNPHSPHTTGAHPFMPPFSPYFQIQMAAANFMSPASPIGLPSLNGLSPMMSGLNSGTSGSSVSSGHGSQSASRHHSVVEGKS